MTRLIHRWMTPRGVLVDAVSNVVKVGLDDWLDPIIAACNAKLDEPITRAEAESVFHADRRTWPLLLRLAQAQRFWAERVRRRPYDFLLKEASTYEAS